jgi:hypothetical protein
MSLINFSIPTIPSFSSTTPDKNPMLFVQFDSGIPNRNRYIQRFEYLGRHEPHPFEW